MKRKIYRKIFPKTRHHIISDVRWFVSLHNTVLYCCNDQTKMKIFRKGATKTSFCKLVAIWQIFYAKQGR